jgi:lysophospholipase L1-like esterase
VTVLKKWLFRFSIGLNLLVLGSVLYTWINWSNILQGFLDVQYAHKTSFFDHYSIEPGDVVMLGDSITEGGLWPEMFPGLPIKNRGISGDTTTGVLSRLGQVTGGKPAAVFLKIGTNDLTHGGLERTASYQQYRQIVVRILTDSPDTEVFLQSLLPRGQAFRQEVEAFNREIRTIAGDLNVHYVDLYPLFLAEDGSIRDELSADELHLNGPGYQLWQSQLEPYLATIVR